MKILLLATPRSGSSTLVKFIDSHIKLSNYKMFIEPFNKNLHANRKYDEDIDSILYLTKFDNILVKNLFLLGHKEYPIKSFNDIYKYLEWCYSYFDKIIILDRRDKLAQSESFTVNETVFREKGIGWHIQKIYDLDKIDKSYLNNMIDRYTKSSLILKEIYSINNFPIFYYEDIFLDYNIEVIHNLLKYLEIDFDIQNYNTFINNKNRRVRIDLPKIKNLI
jgi:LPS sulfotransferase NodH